MLIDPLLEFDLRPFIQLGWKDCPSGTFKRKGAE